MPDQALINLLSDAAKRGVDVRIIVPGPYTDERVCQIAGEAVLAPLLQAGVTILRYQPTLIHAKLMLVDDHLACIGSANMNHRSMCKDDEICCVALSTDLVSTLLEHFEHDAQRSEPVNLDQWRNRSAARKCLEQVTRLFASEM